METASLNPDRSPERLPIGDCTMVLRDAASGRWLSFTNPELVVVAHDLCEVVTCMQLVEERVERDGLFAAGFVSYEAAPAFDRSLSTRSDCSVPLLLFGLYRRPTETCEYPLSQCPEPRADLPNEAGAATWCKRDSDAEYGSAFNRIKCEISAGNLYQINHTVRLQSSDWNEVQMVSRAPYGAHLETDEWLIASASPELFFRLDGREIVSQPMKGTAGRGLDSASDLRARAWLDSSLKNRAENLMITDMVRNDIGRIAEAGSVAVDGLFAVEQFPTVWQMTSTVSAKTTAGVTDIFRALFPAASITGAPKRASMDLISQLEPKPREIYTGAIG